MNDEELLTEKKKRKRSKMYHRLAIGTLAGILIYS